MNFRLFSKTHNLYTNSPLWPSNQRTISEWSITPNGQVLELILFEAGGSSFAHYKSGFEIEPWTGYFDSAGKKIYRGDILRLSCFNLDYEVVWSFDRFVMKALYESAFKTDDNLYPWGTHSDLATNYEIVGNIHGVEYSD